MQFLFLSSTMQQKAIAMCPPLRALCDTNIAHLGEGGNIDYSPTVSRLCPAHGSAQREPGGWSDLKPYPGTLIPGTGAAANVLVKRPGKFGPPPGRGDPVIVVRFSYASTDILPGAWHSWQAMLAVFHVFALRPTRSKRPVRMANALCSLSVWFESMSPL